MKKFIIFLFSVVFVASLFAPAMTPEEREEKWYTQKLEEKDEEISSLKLEASSSDSVVCSLWDANYEYALQVDSLVKLVKQLNKEKEGKVCIPEEQARYLLERAQLADSYEKEIEVQDSIITLLDSIITFKSDHILALEYQVIQQDSVICVLQKTQSTDPWWKKWLYGVGGMLVGAGIGALAD